MRVEGGRGVRGVSDVGGREGGERCSDEEGGRGWVRGVVMRVEGGRG